MWESNRKKRWIHQGTYKGEKLQFNDCIAAPDGSFLAGTFYPTNVLGYEKTGKLYRFYPNGNVEIVSENHGCSNGMGFSPNLDFFITQILQRGKLLGTLMIARIIQLETQKNGTNIKMQVGLTE